MESNSEFEDAIRNQKTESGNINIQDDDELNSNIQFNTSGLGFETVMVMNKFAVKEVSMSSRILDLEDINKNGMLQTHYMTQKNSKFLDENTQLKYNIEQNKFYEAKIEESRKETENLISVLKTHLDTLVDNINGLEETKVKQEMLIRNLNFRLDDGFLSQTEQIKKLQHSLFAFQTEINQKSKIIESLEIKIKSYHSMEQEFSEISKVYKNREMEFEMQQNNMKIETDQRRKLESDYELLKNRMIIVVMDYDSLKKKHEDQLDLCSTHSEKFEKFQQSELVKYKTHIGDLTNEIKSLEINAESQQKALEKKLETIGNANTKLMKELKKVEQDVIRYKSLENQYQTRLDHNEVILNEKENIIKSRKNELDILKEQVKAKETALLSASKYEQISNELTVKLDAEIKEKENILNQLREAKTRVALLEDKIKTDEEKRLTEIKHNTDEDFVFSKAKKYRKLNSSLSSRETFDFTPSQKYFAIPNKDIKASTKSYIPDSDSSVDTGMINLPNELIKKRYPLANKTIYNPLRKYSQGVNLTQINRTKDNENETESTVPE